MKKNLIVLLVMLAPIFLVRGQEPIFEENPIPVERVMPKDSLPDLWIVTIDLTGSMLGDKKYRLIPEGFKEIVGRNECDKNNDCFLLLSSGMTKNELRGSSKKWANSYGLTYCERDFVSLLIKELSDISNYNQVYRNINRICIDSKQFKYERSFASIARPISIAFLVYNKHFDFLNYRYVYHIQITDNGDTNDQWGIEYHFLRTHYEEHFSDVNGVLPKIACSKFDFVSKGTGNFDDKDMIMYGQLGKKEEPLYINLTRYKTFQEEYHDIKSIDSLLVLDDFHNDHFTIQMNPCGDSVKFVYVDSCQINGNSVYVKQYLYPDDKFVVDFDSSFINPKQNKVYVAGSYQEQYHDRILGQRYRKIDYHGKFADVFVSAETIAARQQCLRTTILGVVSTLIAFILFILFWRNMWVLSIFVNGKQWRIKRKAMNRLKNASFELVSISHNEGIIKNVFFYKGRGIDIDDDKKARTNPDKPIILLQTWRKLHNPAPIPIEYPRRVWKLKIKRVYEYNCLVNEAVFSFSDYLKHNLCITSSKESWQMPRFDTNPLQERNFQMLASYYESNAEKFEQRQNNVMVNLIRRNYLGTDYRSDYAVLNIFDLNYGNSAKQILLRYSLVCIVDLDCMASAFVMNKLLSTVQKMLKGEHLEKGTIELEPNDNNNLFTSSIELVVSPMLSYIYIGNGRLRKVIYSPFKDVHIDMSGQFDLRSKTVKLYRRYENLTMSNSPILNGLDFSVVRVRSYYRDTETLSFLGDGKVILLGEEKDYSYGHRLQNSYDRLLNSVNVDKSYYARSLDEIVSAN